MFDRKTQKILKKVMANKGNTNINLIIWVLIGVILAISFVISMLFYVPTTSIIWEAVLYSAIWTLTIFSICWVVLEVFNFLKKGRKVNTRLMVSVLLIIISLLILFFSGSIGSALFKKPAPPPERYATGYATIYCYDPLNKVYVDANITLLYYDNESVYNHTITNKTFYVPVASLAYIQAKGYYNITVTVFASGGNDPNSPKVSTYYIYKVCPKDYVKFQIIKIDDTYGNFTAKDIPDGRHVIVIQSRILEPYRNKTLWGFGTYYPSTFLPNTSYAKLYNLTQLSAWIAWNGTIKNVEQYGTEYKVYRIEHNLNATYMLPTSFDIEHTIEADFYNINNIYIYFGLVDNWSSYIFTI